MVDINSMYTETFDRIIDMKYVERKNGEYRFLMMSYKDGDKDNTEKSLVKIWITEDELDQLILNLIEAKVQYGRSNEH